MQTSIQKETRTQELTDFSRGDVNITVKTKEV